MSEKSKTKFKKMGLNVDVIGLSRNIDCTKILNFSFRALKVNHLIQDRVGWGGGGVGCGEVGVGVVGEGVRGCKTFWLTSLLFWEVVDIDLHGQI